jgi:hypothetical protein
MIKTHNKTATIAYAALPKKVTSMVNFDREMVAIQPARAAHAKEPSKPTSFSEIATKVKPCQTPKSYPCRQ